MVLGAPYYYGRMLLISGEEINGAAFRDLSSEELEEMGFKCGPRKNIMTIIATLEVRALDA